MKKCANVNQLGFMYLYTCVTFTQIKIYITNTPKSSLMSLPSHPPYPQESFFYYHSLVLPILELHIDGIIQDPLFGI